MILRMKVSESAKDNLAKNNVLPDTKKGRRMEFDRQMVLVSLPPLLVLALSGLRA